MNYSYSNHESDNIERTVKCFQHFCLVHHVKFVVSNDANLKSPTRNINVEVKMLLSQCNCIHLKNFKVH